MKKLILTAVLSVASLAAFGQGTIDVQNINKAGGFLQPIFNFDPTAPSVQQTGNPSSTVYAGAIYNGTTGAGTTVYHGAPLIGTGYDLVFFYSLSTSVTSVSQMQVGTVVPFRTSASATAAPAGGIIAVSALTIPGGTGGTPIAFAYGAFSTEGGTVQSWATALANFNSGDALAAIGTGAISTTTLNGSDTTGAPHTGLTSDTGWQSFSLVEAPEPGTIALAGLGAAGLLLFRRRK
jgi:hypothetical protein